MIDEPSIRHEPGEQAAPINGSVDYEAKDFPVQAVITFGLVLALMIGAAHLIVWAANRVIGTQAADSASAISILRPRMEELLPPEPRLQGIPGHAEAPPDELRQVRQADEAILNSYGWVDQQGGIARIPISEAMRLLAAPGQSDGDGSAVTSRNTARTGKEAQ
jgi:hypothetical protein